MLNKIEIIPAIDIIDSKCVRLSEGDFNTKKQYVIAPLEIAKQYEAQGINRLHIVDLDGAKKGQISNLHILENIATHTKLKIDFGGGIKTITDLKNIFNAGASFASIGTLAVKNKILWHQVIAQFGAKKFLLGADVLNEKIKISGWLEDTNIQLFDFLQEHLNIGIDKIFITDIAKDGLLKGPSIELYKKVINRFPTIKLIASGGVSHIDDILHLQQINCYGVIVGKAIYENKIKIAEFRSFL